MAPPWNRRSVNMSWVKNSDRHPDNVRDDRRIIYHSNHSSRNKHRSNPKSFQSVRKAAQRNLIPQLNQFSGNQPGTSSSGEIWIKVTIIYGASLSQEWLKEAIGSALGSQAKFYNIYPDKENLLLYMKIRSKQLSEFKSSLVKLREPNEGKSLSTDVSTVPEPSLPPSVNSSGLPIEWINALKNCIGQRYQATVRTLDLSQLHADHDLLSQGLYLSLNRKPVVNAVCQLMINNKANLATLNLSNNRISSLQDFQSLVHPDILIEHLDLSQNPLNGVYSMNPLKGINGLFSLDVTETPIMNRLKTTESSLINQIRITFPNIVKLNGKTPPASVRFATSTDFKSKPLPPSKKGNFPNDEAKISALQFIKDYYDIYDAFGRDEGLLQYYSRDSVFSFSIAPFNPTLSYANSKSVKVTDTQGIDTIYEQGKFTDAQFSMSRNLNRCRDDKRRDTLLLRGSVSICHSLNKLPASEHLLDTFSVDVCIQTSQLVVINITGLFYEITKVDPLKIKKLLRLFSRTIFVTASEGRIIQDDLTLLQPSDKNCKDFIKFRESDPQTLSLAPNSLATSSSDVKPIISDKDAILQQFMFQTGMNQAYAKQCLEEYSWDAQRAWTGFQATKEAGTIPDEAFKRN